MLAGFFFSGWQTFKKTTIIWRAPKRKWMSFSHLFSLSKKKETKNFKKNVYPVNASGTAYVISFNL